MTDDQLDKWMAEHVGGWKEIIVKRKGDCPRFTYWERETIKLKLSDRRSRDCPNYTGSGELMLEVMEWLDSKDVSVSIGWSGEDEEGNSLFYVSLFSATSGDDSLFLEVPVRDLPRALCELTHEAFEKDWLKEL